MKVSMKKAISSLTIGAILVSSTALFTADAAATSIKYTKYTYATNTTSEYTLTLEEQVNVSTRDTIGSEDRTPDQNDGIVTIYAGTTWVGTGTIIDDHTIACCAHSLAKEGIGFRSNITVALYDENGNETSTRLTAIEAHIASDYIEEISKPEDEADYYSVWNYDYALLTVAEDLSDRIHFELGVMPPSADEQFTANIYTTGIPENIEDADGNKIGNPQHLIYTGPGKIYTERSDPDFLFYTTDTSGGNSGSPTYVKTQFQMGTNTPQVINTIVAIHICGSTFYNRGVRITAPILQFYNNNPNISY